MQNKLLKALAALPLLIALSACNAQEKPTAGEEPPVVRTERVVASSGGGLRLTGVVRARYESNLGFRVSGKIVERLVDPGNIVHKGQALMRLDDTDFVLALRAAHSAVDAARAASIQAAKDEARRRSLVKEGWVTPQVYEQNRASADATAAQLLSAIAQEQQAADQKSYTVLVADSDGVIMETLGEPGQVVTAGQTVVRLARQGPREAEVYLPEGVEQQPGDIAEAALYAKPNETSPARLRELSAIADVLTRTYRARYVLSGKNEQAPLGATVTVRLSDLSSDRVSYDISVGAIFDSGGGPSVWVVDPSSRRVSARAVTVTKLGEERATVTGGLNTGERIVALGAHLLKQGEKIDFAPSSLDTAAR
jgi:RND family efflux transporter MFP subunit